MTRKSKKKVDFGVRPRAAKQELPPTPDQWVKEGQGEGASPEKDAKEVVAEAEKPVKEKRLTLNLPDEMHTAFKASCVIRRTTIQDRVKLLIERDLADGQP